VLDVYGCPYCTRRFLLSVSPGETRDVHLRCPNCDFPTVVRLRDGRVAAVERWDRCPTYPVGERVVCIADEGVSHLLQAGRECQVQRVEWDRDGTELVAVTPTCVGVPGLRALRTSACARMSTTPKQVASHRDRSACSSPFWE
jgi:hypothetical protein